MGNGTSAHLCLPWSMQVITGSHDKTIRMYDIRKPMTLSTLTYHKKSVRGLASHPHDYAFASASADNIKKFSLPTGDFLHNMLQQQRAIVNCIACNEDGVVVSGADNGSLWCGIPAQWNNSSLFSVIFEFCQGMIALAESGILAATLSLRPGRLKQMSVGPYHCASCTHVVSDEDQYLAAP